MNSEVDNLNSVSNDKINKISITEYFKSIIKNYISSLGSYIIETFFHLLFLILVFIKDVSQIIWDKTVNHRKKFFIGIRSIVRFIFKPLVQIINFIAGAHDDIKRERHENGLIPAVKLQFAYIHKAVFGNKGVAVTIFNYVTPIISIAFLFNVVVYSTNMNYAVRLSINGDFIGYIDNEQVYADAERIMQQRITYLDNNTPLEFSPEFSIERVGYEASLNKYNLADIMIQSSGADIEYAYGLYVGDQFYGAVEDKAPIETALENLLNSYRTNNSSESIKFVSEISYTPGLYLSESIVSTSSIIQILTSYKSVAAYYTVVENDSPLSISAKLDISLDEIESLNPGFSDSALFPGDQILIKRDEPYLSVSITRTEQYDVPIKYETIHYDDYDKYVGVQTVTQNGADGISRITADVSYVNGYEISRKVLSKTTVLESVPEEIAIGSKPIPIGASVSTASAPAGQFIWPVGGNGGYISTYLYGYYGHSGIDIAGAGYQTEIYAGASGTVIQSGWYYGYGKCIMIQHDNGLVTLYGHNDHLFVTVGQKVTQGECIALMGSTGISTGVHLHFEVRSGSKILNPIDYLPRSR